MATGLVHPPIPSIETGAPPGSWPESVPDKDTPATPLDTPMRADNADSAEKQPPEASQVPRVVEKRQAEPSATRDQPSVGASATQTAEQHAPKQEIKKTVASHMLSKGGKEDPHVSLPSSELRGAQPAEHTGGVGALPGNLSETSVVLLPDERQERAQERAPNSPRQRRDTVKPSAGDDDEPSGEEGAKISRDAPLSQDDPTAPESSEIPAKTSETRAAEATESGVTVHSASQAELQKETSGTESQNVPGEQRTTAPAEAPAGKDIKESDLASENRKEGKSPPQDVQVGTTEAQEAPPTRKVEGGYGGEYHPAQLHPPPSGASVAEFQSPAGTHQEGQDAPATKPEQQATTGAEKKPGFMTMVKGEMKILAGKMSRDEHKVEEGKKLVHGEA